MPEQHQQANNEAMVLLLKSFLSKSDDNNSSNSACLNIPSPSSFNSSSNVNQQEQQHLNTSFSEEIYNPNKRKKSPEDNGQDKRLKSCTSTEEENNTIIPFISNQKSFVKIEEEGTQNHFDGNEPMSSFFLLLKNQIMFNQAFNSDMLKQQVIYDYLHSSSIVDNLLPIAYSNNSPPSSPEITDYTLRAFNDFNGKKAKQKELPIEKLCLLYSIYMFMCQKKGLLEEASKAYEKTRGLLKQVYDRYDCYYVAFSYCVVSLYLSGIGDDELAKFYTELVEHYFNSNNRRFNSVSPISTVDNEVNTLISMIIPNDQESDKRDTMLFKLKIVACTATDVGTQPRMDDIRKLIKGFYCYSTNTDEIEQEEYRDLLYSRVNDQTFEKYLRFTDITCEMAYETSKSLELEEDQMFFMKYCGNAYRQCAITLIILEYLDFLSNSITDDPGSVNPQSLFNNDERAKSLIPKLKEASNAFMEICYLDPKSLGVLPPTFFSCVATCCDLDYNLTNDLRIIQRDISILEYFFERYNKMQNLYKELYNKLLQKKQDFDSNKTESL
ncbi:hypothetical protein ABK040_011911 [Willaertia magna]